ncbi:ABC transporter substrate-binding protein [Leptolinea sp. HRD-7]|jgi:ABC-type Zn uptake system ZnuABC Zn-binding protein ZnuA|nr:ABC transporter substrate-binding protein [Leptolinea sp. HRD-7]
MKKSFIIINTLFLLSSLMLSACRTQPASMSDRLKIIAAESFLSDIVKNVAGDRATVESLMPLGMDPHAFEPVPSDVAKIANARVIIINGGGIEGWLGKMIDNAGGEHLVIEASNGLQSREAGEKELLPDEPGGDPHFWLDPISVIHYVENIRDGLIKADPEGKEAYTKNADVYIARLKELDATLREEAQSIPAEKRLIVTNHESFGYFADRYGFTIIGTIVPSVSSGASSSAQQLARLVDHIKETGATAIFLETGTNPQLAEQVAKETGIKVVTDLYTHSITGPDGVAPTYIDMMKYNMSRIIENLK